MTQPEAKTAKDLMTDVFAFPHIPYWFTLRQAAGILKNTLLKEDGGVTPPVVLVFDEKYNLVGILALEHLLKGMRPLFEETGGGAPAAGSPAEWTTRPVGTLMTAAKVFVEPDTPLPETARVFIESGLALLPVLENRKKLVGVVRAREIFREFAGLV